MGRDPGVSPGGTTWQFVTRILVWSVTTVSLLWLMMGGFVYTKAAVRCRVEVGGLFGSLFCDDAFAEDYLGRGRPRDAISVTEMARRLDLQLVPAESEWWLKLKMEYGGTDAQPEDGDR